LMRRPSRRRCRGEGGGSGRAAQPRRLPAGHGGGGDGAGVFGADESASATRGAVGAARDSKGLVVGVRGVLGVGGCTR
jgi:hypothetical protein